MSSLSLTNILASIFANHRRDDRETVARVGVKLALEEFPKFYDFDVLRQSTDVTYLTGASTIDLPDGLLKLREVRIMNGLQSYQLLVKNREFVTRLFPDLDTISTGRPIYCYIEGSKIYFAPRTSIDCSIRLSWIILPAFSTTDDSQSVSPDVPLISKYLIAYGTAWVFKSLQLFNEAQQWFAEATNELQAAIMFDQRKPAEDRRIQPFTSGEAVSRDPLDPFNFYPTSTNY